MFSGGKNSGRNKEDDISLFEVVPRKSSNLYDEEENQKGNTVDLLPIKGDKGLIQRKGQRVIKGIFYVWARYKFITYCMEKWGKRMMHGEKENAYDKDYLQ